MNEKRNEEIILPVSADAFNSFPLWRLKKQSTFGTQILSFHTLLLWVQEN